MKLITKVVLLGAPLLTTWLTAVAEDHQSALERSRLQEHLTSSLEESKARAWNLQPEEWQRYKLLMEGPLGLYSPGIDPLTALGIEARTREEQKRFTEMQAHAEYNRVTKLFAYQNAYNETFARLYPNLLPVDLLGASPTVQSSPVTLPARLAVFVSIDCKGCVERVQRLQSANHPFDLYVVGTKGKDELIRGWADNVRIDIQKVRNRDITLNHDAGRWNNVGDKGSFPAVMRQVNGQWERQ